MNRDAMMYGNNRTMRSGRPMQGRPPQDGRMSKDGNMPYNGNGSSCGCTENDRSFLKDCPGPAEFSEIPSGSRQQLLTYINEVSFCAYDLMLYLDTHPEDGDALEYFYSYFYKRRHALKLYEETYGPLRYGHGGPESGANVKWISEAWPWEGGEC